MNVYSKTETASPTQKTDKWPSVKRGKGEGAKWGYGIKSYKLLYIKYMISKDMLWSTRNYSHFSVITSPGVLSVKYQITVLYI